ncbi:MAG TPA: hypothetical protein DDY11_03325 [Leclercia adecarboxylata]|nr:hypothetical protein [Leclercia adecarboxylata]
MVFSGANTFCKFVNQFSFTGDTVTRWATLPRIKSGKNLRYSMGCRRFTRRWRRCAEDEALFVQKINNCLIFSTFI